MPIALFRKGFSEPPVNGEEPGSRYIGSASDAQSFEVVVSQSNYISGGVWDASTQALRAANTSEYLTQAKLEKRRELLLAFKAEYALVWVIDGIAVEEQKDSILAKTAAQRTAGETALVNQAGTLITKIKTKFTDVKNATTEAQVQAIVW